MNEVTRPEHQTALVALEEGKRFLAEARDALAVLDFRNKASAVELYLKQRGDAEEAAKDAAELRLWAERRLGELSRELPKDKGGRPSENGSHDGTSLQAVGDKRKRLRWRQLAFSPEQVFTAGITQARATGELTTAGLRRIIAAMLKPPPVETPPLPAGVYSCIVSDPPWPVAKLDRHERPDQGPHLVYPTMMVDEIAALKEPLTAHLADDCQLFLWVTQKYLPDGLRILEEWGFTYHCLLTWVKLTGMTPFSFMFNTEHVLFGYRGRMNLHRKGLKLSFEAAAERGEHSAKPDVFYDIVRQVSAGPRLEMFQREPHEGFEGWGHEVAGRQGMVG